MLQDRRSPLVTLVAVVVLALLYHLLARIGVFLFPGVDTPTWWLPSAALWVRMLSWIHLASWLGLALISVPVAIVLARLSPSPSAALLRALAVVAFGILLPLAFYRYGQTLHSDRAVVTITADVLKYAVTLPALSWAAWSLGFFRGGRKVPAAR